MNRRALADGIPWLLLLVLSPAHAGVGDMDPAYGQGGSAAGHLLPLADGSALVGLGTERFSYSRIDAHGHPDPAFGNSGIATWPAGFRPNPGAWLRLDDGSTLLGGAMDLESALVRLDSQGRMDPGFAGTGVLHWTTGSSQPNRVDQLAMQPDGRVLVISGQDGFETVALVLARRLDQSLSWDNSFGTGGEAIVADYQVGGSYYTMVETYTHSIEVLKDGYIHYVDDYPPNEQLFPFSVVRNAYLDPDGRPVAQPPPVPALDSSIRHWRLLARLPDGGSLVDGINAGDSVRYVLSRLRADGTPDPGFGAAGSLVLDFGESVPGFRRVSADGRFLYLLCPGHQNLEAGTSDLASVTRIWLQGPSAGYVDNSFGQQGVISFPDVLGVSELQGTADGALLLVGAHNTYRLLPDDTPSPGVLSFPIDYADLTFSEKSIREVRIPVIRSLGHDGSVSVDFSTDSPNGVYQVVEAEPNLDYVSVSGQLNWSDGDSADKFVTVALYAGNTPATTKALSVRLDNASGAARIELPQVTLSYRFPYGGTGTGTGTGSAGSPMSGSSGGGGAIDLEWLLLVTLMAGLRIASRTGRSACSGAVSSCSNRT